MRKICTFVILLGFSNVTLGASHSVSESTITEVEKGVDQNLPENGDGESSEKKSCLGYTISISCFEWRWVQPTARVYFDGGTDDPGEIDLYRDGSINPTIDLVSMYWPRRWGAIGDAAKTTFGPIVGLAISSPPENSDDGMVEASDAPVAILYAGGLIEYEFSEKIRAGIEGGYAYGITSDENVSDNDDSAFYVGLTFNVALKSRE